MTGVYKKIAAVQSAIAKEGMAKSQKNTQQGYAFRGIDDVYNILASKLAENQLCVFPTVLDRTEQIGKTSKGAPLFRVLVKVQYTLVDADDGTSHSVIVYGEAMDTSDKATNKAMSGSFKYFAIQTFCIPTVGDNDADATTHEPKDFGPAGVGPDLNDEIPEPKKRTSSAQLKKDGRWEEIQERLSRFVYAEDVPYFQEYKTELRKQATEEGWPKTFTEPLAEELRQKEAALNAQVQLQGEAAQ